MKKVIKSVLEKFGTQTNLGSESARERITDEIVEALHKNDNYLFVLIIIIIFQLIV